MTSLKRLALEKPNDCFEIELFNGASVRVLLKPAPYVVFTMSCLVGDFGAEILVTGGLGLAVAAFGKLYVAIFLLCTKVFIFLLYLNLLFFVFDLDRLRK